MQIHYKYIPHIIKTDFSETILKHLRQSFFDFSKKYYLTKEIIDKYYKHMSCGGVWTNELISYEVKIYFTEKYLEYKRCDGCSEKLLESKNKL